MTDGFIVTEKITKPMDVGARFSFVARGAERET